LSRRLFCSYFIGLKLKNQKAYALLLNGLNIIIPILTIPIVISSVGVNNYGYFIFSSLIYQLMVALTTGAIFNYAIREYSLIKNSHSTKHSFFKKISSYNIFSFLLSVLVYFLLSVAFLSKLDFTVQFLVGISLLSIVFNVDWYFYAEQNYKPLFYRTLFIRGASLICVLLLVSDSSDLFKYAIIFSATNILTSVISYLTSRLKFNEIGLVNYLLTIKDLKFFLMNSFFGSFYQFADQLVVGVLLTKEQLTFYNLIKQISNGFSTFVVTIIKYKMPNAVIAAKGTEYKEYLVRFIRIFIPGTIFYCFIIFILSPFAFSFLIQNKAELSEIQSFILAVFVFSTSFSVLLDSQVNIPCKKEYFTTISNFCVVVVMLLSMYFTLSIYQVSGAIFSLMIAELTGVISMLFNIRKSRCIFKGNS
jgi:O-antigen/teichoic acid export membrane protein